MDVAVDLADWTARPMPGAVCLQGRTCRIEPYDLSVHLGQLYQAIAAPQTEKDWVHIPAGPFASARELGDFLQSRFHDPCDAWRSMVICSVDGAEVLGLTSYMRNRPDHGSTEIGFVRHGDAFKRTIAATEAHYLMARHVFDDLGYRRYEWKCNAENENSKRAALRYGFTYEGTFRNDMVAKGKNRDTAWYSMIAQDWPALKARFEAWLDPSNFDASGAQKRALSSFPV